MFSLTVWELEISEGETAEERFVRPRTCARPAAKTRLTRRVFKILRFHTVSDMDAVSNTSERVFKIKIPHAYRSEKFALLIHVRVKEALVRSVADLAPPPPPPVFRPKSRPVAYRGAEIVSGSFINDEGDGSENVTIEINLLYIPTSSRLFQLGFKCQM